MAQDSEAAVLRVGAFPLAQIALGQADIGIAGGVDSASEDGVFTCLGSFLTMTGITVGFFDAATELNTCSDRREPVVTELSFCFQALKEPALIPCCRQ